MVRLPEGRVGSILRLISLEHERIESQEIRGARDPCYFGKLDRECKSGRVRFLVTYLD